MRRILFLVCLSLMCSGTAEPCSCIRGGACRPVRPNDVMFLGKVTSREAVDHKEQFGGQTFRRQTNLFHILALENFAGDQRVGQEMLIETGNGGGDCGYPFRIGETYLVDAYAYNGALSTGICGITGPAVVSTPVLRQLRTLAAGGRLPDLTGLVGIRAGSSFDDIADFRPLSAIPVTVTAAADGTSARAITDGDGVYTLPTLLPGKYTVSAALPPNLSTWQTEIDKKPLQIEVPDVKGTGAACRQDVMALHSGSISGRVVNADGDAVTGFISAHSTDPQKNPRASWAAAGNTEADGNFTLHFLPEGTYRLQFAEKGNFKKVWFYPGTTQPLDAPSISLLDGEHVQAVRFVIPSAISTAP
jgi:hypothetical protein